MRIDLSVVVVVADAKDVGVKVVDVQSKVVLGGGGVVAEAAHSWVFHLRQNVPC